MSPRRPPSPTRCSDVASRSGRDGGRVVRRALVTVALLLFAAGVWWLWPATLGGRTTYLVTQGVSMEPRFHSGDLALVRPASGYAVGDVVAYRSAALHTVVLHRIVAVEGGRFQLRGDNNSWLDPGRVPPSDVLGRLWGACLGVETCS